ncbi:MAG: hypothetical protein ACJA1H_001501 [Glaciecola sp.]
MKRIISLFSFIVIIAIVTWSCERDDICAEATPTTPRLIIRFYDINNPNNLKQVRQLEVDGLNISNVPNSETPIVTRSNTDSINLPLNFQEEVETSTRFLLERDADYADNEDLTDDSNSDIITITYTPEFVYVSRACGYKSIFNLDLDDPVTRETDDNIWTTSFEIINFTIENENAAQIKIYH